MLYQGACLVTGELEGWMGRCGLVSWSCHLNYSKWYHVTEIALYL
jgi:hypothetical protein